MKLKLTRRIVGKWVTVYFTDVGRRDAVVVDILTDGKITKQTQFRVYEPLSTTTYIVDTDQIVAVRDYLQPN